MNIADLREKRNRVLVDANTLMQAETVTAEIRTQFDIAMTEVDTIDGDIKRLERSAPAEAAQRTTRPAPGAAEDNKAEVRSNFLNYMRTGKIENRDLLTINAAGAATIPQAFYPEIIAAQKAWGGIVNVVKNFNSDSGAPMKISLANDTANMLAPVTEGTASSEVDPTITSVISSTDELRTGIVKVSLSELNDSAFDLDGFVRNNFGKQYWRGLSSLITNGDSANFASIITGYASGEVTSKTAATLAYADIVAAYAALDPAYIDTATWVMNASTRAALLGIVDTLGRPIFVPSPSADAFGTLLGRPVVLNQAMANVATGNVALQFGSFQDGYLLRSVNPGLAIIRLNERFLDSLEVGFIGYARAGGVVTNPGIAPIVNVVVR
jgi:HK97 family phage major capsid protein